MIIIGNIKTFRDNGTTIPIKIDRSSVLGNPFYMHNENDRDLVCDKYEAYFYKKINEGTDTAFIEELDRIYIIASCHNVTLLCWCYPLRCHGETIKEYINTRIYREGKANLI